jgi:hypothetical protein
MELHQRVLGIALILFAGLFAAVANAQDEPAAKAEQAPEVIKRAPANRPVSIRGHGVMLSSDGRLRGVASSIDPDTLQLVPVSNIDIVFVQNGRIISKARSGADGRFEAEDLTPQAVYSVIAKSRQGTGVGDRSSDGQPLYSAFSLAVLAHLMEDASAQTRSNRQFISLIKQDDGGIQIINGLQLTMIPARDLAAVGLQQTFSQQPGAQPPLAGGGGGGGGGGGSGVAAAGIGAAAVAAGVAGSQSSRRIASPFTP